MALFYREPKYLITGGIAHAAAFFRRFWSAAGAEERKKKRQRIAVSFL